MIDIQHLVHPLAVPTPFPVGAVNLYLIEGTPLTLVDVGPRTEAAQDVLIDGLAQLGYRLSDIEQVVVTHSHLDHIGLLQGVVEASGAQVLSHHKNFYWLVDFEVEWVRRLAFYSTYLYQAGLPEEQVAEVRELMAPGVHMGASIPADRLCSLHHGEKIEAGGIEWSVLHMPGHASGHLVLYQPDARLVIAGDLLLAKISSNPVLESPARGERERPRSLVEYLDSLSRLAALDVSRLLAGHGPPILDHRGLVAERIAMHRDRLTQIVGILAEGRRTPYQVCQALFPNLAEYDIFLGMSEVIGHLDILEAEGRIVAEQRDGLWYYTAPHQPVRR